MKKGKDICHIHDCRSSHGGSRGDGDDEDRLIELEALLAKIFPRGTGKYKGKLPLKYFSCNKIGHIVAKCLDGDKNEKFWKFKGKGNKHCYVAVDDGVTNEE